MSGKICLYGIIFFVQTKIIDNICTAETLAKCQQTDICWKKKLLITNFCFFLPKIVLWEIYSAYKWRTLHRGNVSYIELNVLMWYAKIFIYYNKENY